MTVTLGLSSMKIGALRQLGDGGADLGPVLGADPAGLQALPVDLGLGGQQALGQFEVAHLEREEERRAAGPPCPTWARMPRAKLVLPMPGRAPTMTSEEGWRPSRILSSSL